MTCLGDGLGPQEKWSLELRQHRPCHIHKGPVLPLGYTILLRGIRSGILMSNSLFTNKLIYGVVLELGAIVTCAIKGALLLISNEATKE